MTIEEYNKQVLKEIFPATETEKPNIVSTEPRKYVPCIRFEDADKYTDYRSNVNYPGYEGL